MSSGRYTQTETFIEIPDSPLYECNTMQRISPTEFVAISRMNGVYKYSSSEAQWSRLLTIQKMPDLNHLRLYETLCSVYEEVHHRLFIADKKEEEPKLISVNLTTGTKTNYPQCRVPIDSMSLIGDKIHIFGVQYNPDSVYSVRHCIFDIVTGEVVPDSVSFVETQQWHYCAEALFCKSRKSILIGCIMKDRSGSSFVLMEYSLNTQQYRRLEWSAVDLCYFTAMISTLNERYIVMFDQMFIRVYDLWEERVSETDIRYPHYPVDDFHAVLMGNNERDELTMFGFVREVFKATEMKDVSEIPSYLIQLMSKWYSNEKVHLIKTSHGNHWMIDMDKIIQSISL